MYDPVMHEEIDSQYNCGNSYRQLFVIFVLNWSLLPFVVYEIKPVHFYFTFVYIFKSRELTIDEL